MFDVKEISMLMNNKESIEIVFDDSENDWN